MLPENTQELAKTTKTTQQITDITCTSQSAYFLLKTSYSLVALS